MVRKIKTLAVDINFFKEYFEKERVKTQNKLGISNLSQVNFTKMIKGFKIKQPKQNLSQVNTRIRRRRNVKI